jgi:hypothetical protein
MFPASRQGAGATHAPIRRLATGLRDTILTPRQPCERINADPIAVAAARRQAVKNVIASGSLTYDMHQIDTKTLDVIHTMKRSFYVPFRNA